MGDDGTLLKFCAARREITNIDESSAVERKRLSRSVSTCKDVLKEQLLGANAKVVPIICNGKQLYAHLRPKTSHPALTVEAVLDVVKTMTYTNTSSTNTPSTLEDWVEACIRARIERPPQVESLDHPTRLSITTKKPVGEECVQVHPALQSRIQETANLWYDANDAAKTLRAKHSERKKVLNEQSKAIEQSVAEHLVQHDPATGSRKIRLVTANEESTFYLRRKQTTRSTRPTARTAVPAIKKVIKTLSEQAGRVGPPGWDALRWLQSAHTLKLFEAEMRREFEKLTTSRGVTKVTLDRV